MKLAKTSITKYCFIITTMFISGLFTQAASAAWETYTDRPGLDYNSFRIDKNIEAFTATKQCQDACSNETKCRAFTYVLPGVESTDGHCYLKEKVSAPVYNTCCTSGIVRPETKSDYCSQYTSTAIMDNRIYLNNQCGHPDSMWNSNYNYHYDWCMRVPREMSQGSNDARKNILAQCHGPSKKGDLSVIDWCYRQSDNKINFYPVIRNTGTTTWNSAKKGNVQLSCSVHNSPNLSLVNSDITLHEWPKSQPIAAGEVSVLNKGCSWDLPKWNLDDEYRIEGWQLKHTEDSRPENNRQDKIYKLSARDIKAGKFRHKECKASNKYLSTNLNIWAEGLEITQAIQEWVLYNDQSRNDAGIQSTDYPNPAMSYEAALLVKGRSTVVRVYGAIENTISGTGIADIDATLRCYTDSAYKSPCPGTQLLSPKSKIQLDPKDTFDNRRKNAALTWNFKLPESWLNQDRIWLEATVNESAAAKNSEVQECIDCFDTANRIRLGNIIFFDSPNFSQDIVEIVKIRNTFNDSSTEPTESDLQGYLEFLRKVYPVKEDTVQTTYDSKLDYSQISDDPKVECSRLHPFLLRNVNPKGKKAVHAFIAPPYPCTGAGASRYGFTKTSGDTMALAHELGHAAGLLHAGPPPGHGSRCKEHEKNGLPCAECQNNACDKDWPWPHGTIGGYGFDVLDPELQTVYPPGSSSGSLNESNAHDFMSYGGPTMWISQRNWTRLYNAMMGKMFPYRK